MKCSWFKDNFFLISMALTSVLSLNTYASENPQFSYQTELKTFSSAIVPTALQMEGTWMLVGEATDPNSPNQYNGYWPDGKLPNGKNPGRALYDVLEFSLNQSASRLLVLNEATVDVASSAVLKKLDAINVTEIGTGFQYEYPTPKYACSVSVECRLVTATGILLCGQSTGPAINGDHCQIQSTDPVFIVGYVRKP